MSNARELADVVSTSPSTDINIDNGTLVVDISTDRVGIGTTTPGSTLDVQGTLTVGVDDTGYDVKFFGATAGAYLEWDESADELEIRGGAATPGKLLLSTAETTVVAGNKLGQIDFQAPLDSAGTDAILVGASIHAEADDTFAADNNATELVFSTGASEAATEKMRIDSVGNVGIGSTSPSSTFRASINGDGSSIIGGVEFRNAASGGSTFTVGMATATSPSGKINVVSAGNLILQTNDTERMRIDSSGKVGIGTTAPSYKLTINTADEDHLRFENGSEQGFIRLLDDGILDFWAHGDDEITFRNGSASGTERMRITSDGKVGIGTTAPDVKLHVYSATDHVTHYIESAASGGNAGINVRPVDTGSAFMELGVGRTGNGYAIIDFVGDATYADYGLRIIRNNTGPNTHSQILHRGTGFFELQTSEASDIIFSTSSTERLRIDSSGNVGIGVTSPDEKLHVNSDVKLQARRRGYIFAEGTSAGHSGTYTVDVSGFSGHGQASSALMARFYFVSVMSTATSHQVQAVALYTTNYNASAILLDTFGKYEYGGSITFGNNGHDPRFTITNSTSNTPTYYVEVTSLN